jgi:hypothetical protein
VTARRGILLAAALVAAGCGTSSRAIEVDDRVAAKNVFIEVVRECYRERQDGVLQEPTVDPNRVRLVFQYGKEVDGAEAEWIELKLAQEREASSSAKPRTVCRVLVCQPLSGPNRVLDEPTRRIEAKLRERLGAPPK